MEGLIVDDGDGPVEQQAQVAVRPRAYQLELFEASMRENVIVTVRSLSSFFVSLFSFLLIIFRIFDTDY